MSVPTGRVETTGAGQVVPAPGVTLVPMAEAAPRTKPRRKLMRQTELVDRVKAYDPDADEALLNKAYVYAMKAHGQQFRASGDPYFAHPLEVAGILTELKLDVPTIATALLHDTIEDTAVTYDDIKENFGEEIAGLVDGVTKLSKLELFSERTKQAENFRKLMLAMSNDIRVLLVKLADRLHNMRTLHFIKNAGQAPAHRTGDGRHLCAARGAHRHAARARRARGSDLRRAQSRSAQFDRDALVPARRAIGRPRRAHRRPVEAPARRTRYRCVGLWARQAALFDLAQAQGQAAQFRIPFRHFRLPRDREERGGLLSGARRPAHQLADDSRALQGFHFHSEDQRLPLDPQHRHRSRSSSGSKCRFAPKRCTTSPSAAWRPIGVIASASTKSGAAAERAFEWLRDMVDLLEKGDSVEEFLEHSRLHLYQDQVFCFTPKGDLISLPRGATPIDFAYAVHTDLGNTTVGVKVNGVHVPLHTPLKNGDQVEIIRTKDQTPSPLWEQFVVTGRARAEIRRYLRQARRDEHANLGRKVLEKVFADEGVALTAKAIGEVAKKLQLPKPEEVYAQVGRGALRADDVLLAVYPEIKRNADRNRQKGDGARNAKQAISIHGLTEGVSYRLGQCCHPLPGDRIVGLMVPGEGVVVHTIDCEELEKAQSSMADWLDVKWDTRIVENATSIARVLVRVKNAPGSLAAAIGVIGANGGNIFNLKVVTRTLLLFEFLVDIEVRDVAHLQNILGALRVNAAVESVERVRGPQTGPEGNA